MEKIWPVVEQANAQAPTHSRILPEMIEILPSVLFLRSKPQLKSCHNSYGTQIPIATKMSILRPACYVKFKDIIGTYTSLRYDTHHTQSMFG
jgi:hypothetical protein